MICKKRLKREGTPCYYYIPPETSGEAGFCRLPTEFRCIEAVKFFSPRLSFSAGNDWTSCRFKYYLGNIKGIRKRAHMKSDPLKLGSVWDVIWNEMFKSGEVDVNKLLAKLFTEAEKMQLSDKNVYVLGALVKGLSALEFVPPVATPQVKMQYIIPDKMNLIGYADGIASPNMFEVKLSSKPAW